jgi:hypothetical protein
MWGDTLPKKAIWEWSVNEKKNSKSVKMWTSAKTAVKIEHKETQNKILKNVNIIEPENGKVKIDAHTFIPGSSQHLEVRIKDENSPTILTQCSIQLVVAKDGTENIPIKLYSDLRFTNRINIAEDHSFSCNVKYLSSNKNNLLLDSAITYEIDFKEVNGSGPGNTNQARKSEHLNSMSI